jgi:hypothetical protein
MEERHAFGFYAAISRLNERPGFALINYLFVPNHESHLRNAFADRLAPD